MALKTCAQCYILYVRILYWYYINMYILVVVYIEVKHLTTIVKNALLNKNSSQNTYLFMTYNPEPFHNHWSISL